jgi:cytochrome P450
MTDPMVLSSVFDDRLHETLGAARAAGRTVIDADSGAVVVLRYDDVEHLAHAPRAAGVGLTFFDFMGIGDGPLRDWYGRLMFTNEGEVHHRLRRLAARAFTPRAVERHRQLAADLTRSRLDQVLADGGGDLVAAFADLPITVICRLLGVPDDEVGHYLAYGDALSPVFGFMDADQIAAAGDAVESLSADVDRTIAARRGENRDDLIGALLAAEEDGHRLTHVEVVTMVGNLIVGGHDTTASQVGCTLLTLLRHPDALARLRAGEVSVAHVVDETIRFEPSLEIVPRTATQPMEVADRSVEAGTMVFLSTASANRHDAVWGDPEVVRPDRFAAADAPRLLSFGSGAHYCLGAALARMTLHEVATGFADVSERLAPADDLDAVEWRRVLGRSPSALHVAGV